MKATKLALACVLGAATLGSQTGCFFPPEVTAIGKILGGQISQLNAAEVQALARIAIQQSNAPISGVTTQQAQAVVSFIRANDIDTVEDIQRLIDNPDDVVIPDDVLEVLELLIEGDFGSA